MSVGHAANISAIMIMIIFAELHNPDSLQAFFIRDEFHYLNVPRVGTRIVHGIFDCTFKCLNNPSCLSLNLAASKTVDEKLWCAPGGAGVGFRNIRDGEVRRTFWV